MRCVACRKHVLHVKINPKRRVHLWCTEFVDTLFGLKRSKQPPSATPKVCSLQMASGINSTGAFYIFLSCDMRFLHLFPTYFSKSMQPSSTLSFSTSVLLASFLKPVIGHLLWVDSCYILFQQTVSLCKVSCASMVGKPDLFCFADFASQCFCYSGGQRCAAWWWRMLLLPVALPHWRHYLFLPSNLWMLVNAKSLLVPGFWFLLCWCWLWVSRRRK